MKSFQYVWFAVLSLLLFGCRGELHQEPGNVEVEVVLKQAGLELLTVKDVGDLPNAPAGRHAIQYIFEPEDGGPIVEGVVADTRILRSEFDRAGQPDPQELVADVAIFDVRVPRTKGHLLLRSEQGEALGEVVIDPTGVVDGLTTRMQPLLREQDILADAVKVVDHGPSSKKADILFLPEGYTERDLPQFHQHVDAIVAQLKTHSGYKEHWSGFNVWRQDVRSRETGTGIRGVARDTAFETASGISGVERCLFFAGSAGLQAARRLAQEAGADATVILVNSTAHGGCATNGVVVSARPRNVADVVGHELAHGLFGLADEYETPRANGTCSDGPNVSVSSSRPPWADMLTTRDLPTPANASFGTVGTFEGGGYCNRGRYRPTHNCMMRTLGAGMCPVCRREVERTMATLAPQDVTSGTAEVRLTNDTGAPIWVRCDGQASLSCSDWTYFAVGDQKEVRAPGRRVVLHNTDFDHAVEFDVRRVTVPADSATMYANQQNPFVPSATQPSTSGTDNSGGTTSGSTLATPSNLFPDNDRQFGSNVSLTWDIIPGVSNYDIRVELQTGNSWTQVLNFGTNTNAMNLLMSQDGRYRWHVVVCNSSTCQRSLDAFFQVEGVTPTDNPAPAGAPSTPTDLSPQHEATVAAGTVALGWDSAGSGATYNLSLRYWDDASAQWYSAGDVNDVATNGAAVQLETANTWYAWSVQACSDAGCSEWAEFSLMFAQ